MFSIGSATTCLLTCTDIRHPSRVRRVARACWTWGLAFCLAFVFLVSGFTDPPRVAAQSVEDPSRVERRFERQVVPRAGQDPGIVLPERQREAVPDGGLTFPLRRVIVEGSSIYRPERLADLYAEFIDQDVSLSDLNLIAERVTDRYRGDGYLLARAILPPQEVDGGTVRVRVIEGFIGTVTVRNARAPVEKQIRLITANLAEARPLNTRLLERDLLLINDLPGISARAVIAPAEEGIGAAELVLDVSEDRFGVASAFDNRGSEFVGPYQSSVTGQANNVLPIVHSLTGSFVSTPELEELLYFRGGFAAPLGGDGIELSATLTHSRTRPGSTLEDLDIRGVSTSIEVDYAAPLLRTRTQNLFGTLRFAMRSSETDQFVGSAAEEEVTDDRLRTISLSMTYDRVDNWNGISLVEVAMTKGLDILWNRESGSELLSRENGRTDFFKLTAELQRVQDFGDGMSAVFQMSGQYSFDSLLAYEEFGYGGSSFGRAFDPSEITGDHGLALGMEFRYDLQAANDLLGPDILRGVQLFGFADIGRTWRRDPTSGFKDSESAASIGLGTRFSLFNYLQSSVEVAQPLLRDVDTNGTRAPRVFFTISVAY